MKPNTIGRREFVSQIAATAATVALGAEGAALAATASPTTLDLKTATSGTFKAVVGQSFKIAGNTAPFVLDQVKIVSDPNAAKKPKGVRKETFSVLLSAPSSVHLKEGTYTLSNAKLGTFSVYLNETRPTSTFSNKSAIGQAELFVRSTATNANATTAKSYFLIPFS